MDTTDAWWQLDHPHVAARARTRLADWIATPETIRNDSIVAAYDWSLRVAESLRMSAELDIARDTALCWQFVSMWTIEQMSRGLGFLYCFEQSRAMRRNAQSDRRDLVLNAWRSYLGLLAQRAATEYAKQHWPSLVASSIDHAVDADPFVICLADNVIRSLPDALLTTEPATDLQLDLFDAYAMLASSKHFLSQATSFEDGVTAFLGSSHTDLSPIQLLEFLSAWSFSGGFAHHLHNTTSST